MGDTPQHATPLPRFYRMRQLKARFNVSGSAIWAWTKKGTFPQPIKLSENTTAWIAPEIEAWEQSRIEAREKKEKVLEPAEMHENDNESRGEPRSLVQEVARE
ncbi:AlpA family transcriptional regulator [Nitrosospira sp. Nsp13]|uniref:helix-turn-helix transcriptional regulator n=1 Tax=Nitrosospira sp. Nsp13 TaxID=1855332 RepID=UPI000883128C|nr:AlpA family phage regulatory protein [Nitrosospira sp. Nsp13]SCY13562.1 transcriptional regulator, AlpA family [Nitrosospira sp. Nsp13]